MKKSIFMLLLALVSTHVMADWVKVSSSDELDIYIDSPSIQKTENTAKIWQLYDYKKPQVAKGVYFQSIKFRTEYDCSDMRSRLVSVIAHSGKMGDGEVINSDSRIHEWIQFPPDSENATTSKFVCSRTALKTVWEDRLGSTSGVSTWLGRAVGTGIIPVLISLICLALVRPKTLVKAAAIVTVIYSVFAWMRFRVGESLENDFVAAVFTYLFVMGAYWIARRLIRQILNHSQSNNALEVKE